MFDILVAYITPISTLGKTYTMHIDDQSQRDFYKYIQNQDISSRGGILHDFFLQDLLQLHSVQP